MIGDSLLPVRARHGPGPRDTGRLPLALGTAVGITAAILLATMAVGDASTRQLAQTGLIGLVVLSVATWFATLGFTNIERFVIITLIARASLDILKPGGGQESALAPGSLLAIGFLIGAGIWLLSVKPLPKPRPGIVFGRALILLMAAATISAVGAGTWGLTIPELLRIGAAIIMYFLVDRLLADTGRPLRIVHAILLAGVVPITVGFFGSALGLHVTETKVGDERVVSTFTIANPYAFFLTFLGLTALALAAKGVGLRYRRHYAVFAAVCAGALITTNVRTAWIAFAIGALVIGLTVGWRTVLVVVAAIAIVVISVPSVSAQFTEISETKAYSDNISENSLSWRVSHWKALFPLTHGHEITGIGVNMTVTSAPDVPKLAHNDYLRSYLEMGIVGFAAFMFLIGASITIGVRAYRAARTPTNRGVSLAFLSVSIALAVACLTDNLISNVAVLWYFYALAACATWCLRASLAPSRQPEQLVTD